MLEGLGKLDWSALSHAYGTAEDVPDLLRALASREALERRRALDELYSCLVHQGDRYEATARAVPFLFELLDHPEVMDKPEIVWLLNGCAIGDHVGYLPGGLDTGPWRSTSTRSAAWMIDAYDAVRQRLPTLVRLAEDPDPKLRLAATFALAWFREEAAYSISVVGRRVDWESDLLLRANAVLTLGLLAKYVGQDESPRLTPLLSSQNPQLRLAAAIAIATFSGEPTPSNVVDILVEGFERGGESALAWHDGDLRGYATMTLASVGPRFEEALPRMLDALRKSTDELAFHMTCSLLDVLFPYDRKPASVKDLTPVQHALLKVLAETPDLWQPEEVGKDGKTYNHLWGILGGKDLPSSRKEMRDFLTGEREADYALRPLGRGEGGLGARPRGGIFLRWIRRSRRK